MHKITTAWLTTNYTCNCNCDWCYARKMLATHRTLDLQYAKQLVNYLNSKGIRTITLIGGEPTLYPYIEELIIYIKSFDMTVRMATNGKMFSDIYFAKKLVDAGIDRINISIKGINESEYHFNTHSDGFKKMITGYNNLVNLGFEPSISYVVASNNTYVFDAFLKMLKHENLNKLLIQFEKPALSLNNSVKTMDIRDMGKLCSYIFPELESSGIDYVIEISFPLCLIENDILNAMIDKKRIATCCHVQKGTGIVFDVTGEVIPCNHFMGYPFIDRALDIQNDNAIEDLLNMDIVKTFKQTVNRYPTTKCEHCDRWCICGGGCFTRWFYLDPNKFI